MASTSELAEPLLRGRGGGKSCSEQRSDRGDDEKHQVVGARCGTPISSAINLAATAMGTGMLTLPFAFARCGPGRCLVLLAILAVTTDVTLLLLVRAGHATGLRTLGEIMQLLFGRIGSASFQLMMAVVLFLALTAMQRVVLDLLPMFLEELVGLPGRSLQPVIVSIPVNAAVLVACLSRSFHGLRFTSGAALVCLLPFVVAILSKAVVRLIGSEDPISSYLATSSTSFEGFLMAAPLLASSLCCHFSILDIDYELQPRYRNCISSVIHCVALGVIPATYALVSLAGVILFGANTTENILTQFHGDIAMHLARGVLSLTNALRMPLIAVPLYRIVQGLGGNGKEAASSASQPNERPWAGMMLLLVLSLGTASKMLVLTRVMGLLGGTGGVLGCFCLPGLMYICLPRAGCQTTRSGTVLSAGAICVGCLVALAGALTWS